MKNVKKQVSFMLLLALLCNLFPITTTYAASTTAYEQLSDSTYAIVYTLEKSGKTITYTTCELSQRGTEGYANNFSYIDNGQDDLRLFEVGINSKGQYWARVSYPVTGTTRRKTAYIPLEAITTNTYAVKTVSTGKFYCSLRQDGVNSSAYYVAKNDTVWLLSVNGNRCQILYPISNGKYRIAFANVSDYEKYCGKMEQSNSMEDVTAFFAGKTITLKSVENGKYLCADGNFTGTPLLANRDGAAGWETFIISSVTSDGWVGFKAYNGNYLSAMAHTTNTPIGAQYENLNSWECFRIYKKNNEFYIKAQINNKWLSTRVDLDNAPIQVVADNASTWERFQITYDGGQNGELENSTTSIRQKLVNYALSQVGIGDKKGDNNVIYNEWYYGKPTKGTGYAWCAAFVSYCAKECGVLNTYIPRHCYCPEGVNWFKEKGQFYKSQYYGGSYIPKAGDIVYYTKNGTESNHIGIVIDSPVNGYLQVVEGNVYCSNGDYKVVKFTANEKRHISSDYVLGYGVPNY